MNKLIFYFLLRSKVKYEVIMIIVMGIHTSIQGGQNQYGTIYSSILLSNLYIVYFRILNLHKGRINLLYKGNTIKKLKYDIIKSVSILSLNFFFIVVILDVFLLKTFYLSLYHMITLVVFILSTLFFSINIEKTSRKDNKIITFEEGFKVVSVGVSLIILATVFTQFI